MEFSELLKVMWNKKASDLFLTVGLPATIKVDGKLEKVTREPMAEDVIERLLEAIMSEKQHKEFLASNECNFAISPPGIGRFRISAFRQRNLPGLVMRRIENRIPLLEDLELPEIIKELSTIKRGLVIFAGATGTGKSTSLAAMIGHRNTHGDGHVISIEDPIEFVHEHNHCIITQREVGIDTESYGVALRNTLRQAPDVILIGEIRTADTMRYAMQFAETGHLCLATIHANNADQALDRIINFFREDEQHQVWMELSLNLKAIVAQQLLPRIDREGRKAIVEILLNTPLMEDIIRKGEIHKVKELMARSNHQGMSTFDQALLKAYKEKSISYDDALAYADSANNLRLMIKLDAGNAGKIQKGSTIDKDGEWMTLE